MNTTKSNVFPRMSSRNRVVAWAGAFVPLFVATLLVLVSVFLTN